MYSVSVTMEGLLLTPDYRPIRPPWELQDKTSFFGQATSTRIL